MVCRKFIESINLSHEDSIIVCRFTREKEKDKVMVYKKETLVTRVCGFTQGKEKERKIRRKTWSLVLSLMLK